MRTKHRHAERTTQLEFDNVYTELTSLLNQPQLTPGLCVLNLYPNDPPAGWLVCDGQEYSTREFPDLFNAIGYSGGVPAQEGNFKVPDLTGARVSGFDWMVKT